MLKPAKKIVICETAENVSESGLALADEEGGKTPETGKIIAIGEGKPPVEIKVGDEIVYRRYAENKTMVDGKELNFINFEDIVAVK